MEKAKVVKVIIWTLLVAFCIAMTIYECYTITGLYFSYAVLHQKQSKYNYSLEFPAITLCSNNPANRLLFNEPNNRVLERLSYFEENIADTKRLFLILEPDVALINALYNLSESERFSGSTSWGNLNFWCAFGYQGCSLAQWYKFNSLYYGNCLTFNHETGPEAGKTANDLMELSFNFINELVERIDNLNRSPTFVMVVHPYGTAPVLHPSRNIHISPGDVMTVSLTQSVTTKLPFPYVSNCVNSEDEAIKNTTVFYRPDKQYLYSTDACVMTCEQELRMKYCRCVEPTIPVSESLLKIYGNLPLCIIKQKGSPCYTELVNKTRCNCPLPCKATHFYVETRTRTIANDDFVVSNYNQLISSRAFSTHHAHNLTYRDGKRDSDKFRSHRSTVIIRFKTTVYEEITEHPKLTFTDFLGFIGGNIGLWLGMSVLSVFDVFNFLSLKITTFYHLMKHPNSRAYYLYNHDVPRKIL